MTDDSTPLGFEEAMDFLAGRVEEEESKVTEDVPNHASALIADEATTLLQTTTTINISEQMETEAEEGITDEEAREMITEDAVNIITALAVLKHEEDLDISSAVDERIAFLKNYAAFREAMEAADGREEEMAAVEEHLTEELAAELGMEGQMEGGQTPTIGANVDKDDYSHDQVEKTFQ